MNIGIEDKKREEVVEVLHQILADQHIFYQKLRNFHWNVKGKSFYGLHKLFEEYYEELFQDIDVVAERIQSLGFSTKGNYDDILALAELKESTGDPDYTKMLEILLADNEHLVRKVRQASSTCGEAGDVNSEGILTDLVGKYEKYAWMLRSMQQ